MRISALCMAALLVVAPAVGAQDDAAARAKARQDSIAKAVRDSIALMKELGGALAAPTDSSAAAQAPAQNQPTGPQGGPTNPRLLPDISAVGDFVADLSPDGSTQEDGARFSVREVELAVQAVVDPYFRGDVFLGISDLEGIAIEQAFLTTTSLPHQLELRLGRYLMPFGKQNTTHRHDLHTIEYPYVIQRFYGPEGLKGTGIQASRVFSPFGFYQEFTVNAVDRLGEREEGLSPFEPVNKSLGGLGYAARFRNYVDISEASNFELSFSAITGKREQPLEETYAAQLSNGVNAAVARQSVLGADLTYRWRPLQQGLYKSFILQGEIMHQINESDPGIPGVNGCADCAAASLGYAGPTRDFTGAYVFARWQLTQRGFIGSRYDWLQDPQNGGRTQNAGSVYLEWFPSEFSKLVAGYEAVSPSGGTLVNRLLLQASFALGPHKPHPF
ncbi:MAG: hypothetical protein ACJ79A_20090 [Gemmatimonadaceae bacterium]